MRFLQVLEGKNAKTAIVVVVTRDRAVLAAATRALNERLQDASLHSITAWCSGRDAIAIGNEPEACRSPGSTELARGYAQDNPVSTSRRRI
jgi:hypothetical protein